MSRELQRDILFSSSSSFFFSSFVSFLFFVSTGVALSLSFLSLSMIMTKDAVKLQVYVHPEGEKWKKRKRVFFLNHVEQRGQTDRRRKGGR